MVDSTERYSEKIPNECDKINAVRNRLAYHCDEVTFRAGISASKVLLTEDHSQWDWDVIYNLCAGSLFTPRRLEELVKSRFIWRLFMFLKPSSHQFSDIPQKSAPYLLLKTAILFLKNLVKSAEGTKQIVESRLFHDIAESLTLLVAPVSHINSERSNA